MPLRYLRHYYWRDSAIVFNTTCLELPKWRAIYPGSLAELSTCLHIWHVSQPLSHFLNDSTHNIIEHIENDLMQWLEPDSLQPAKIPPRFMLVDKLIDLQTLHFLEVPLQQQALALLLSYVDQIAQEQRDLNSLSMVNQLQWVEAEDTSSYSEPVLTFSSPCPGGALANSQMAALLLLMRSPQYHDGTSDYMFERYMKSVVALLFGTRASFLPDSDCVPSLESSPHCFESPLLAVGGCTDFSDEIKEKMAASVEPTLRRIIGMHETSPNTSLPSFCFVYGIHWSTFRVRILIHFPQYNDELKEWEFRQVVVTEYYNGCSLRETESRSWYFLHEDDMFLNRWRLALALFSVLAQVNKLEAFLYPSAKAASRFSAVGRPIFHQRHLVAPRHRCVEYMRYPSLLGNGYTSSAGPARGGQISDYLQRIRDVWANGHFEVPNSWISSLPVIDTKARIKREEDMRITPENIISQKIAQLAMCYLSVISDFIRPLSDSELVHNHDSQDALYPDYLLPMHLPRIGLFIKPSRKKTPLVDTKAYLYKFHDFMSMQVANWHDVNIYIANVFSGFRSYGVRWRPYVEPEKVSHVILDFALVVQHFPPTADKSMLRTVRMPPTIISPAVLLGFRSDSLDDDTSIFTLRDMEALQQLVAPHIDTLAKHLKVLLHSGSSQDPSRIPWPVIFCTYLKAGCLHIIACTHASRADESVHVIVVDSVPLVMQSRSVEDHLNRMRLLTALFTLQRHVVRFSKNSDGVIWPSEVIDEDGGRIAAVGLDTPASSICDSQELNAWDDEEADDSLSDYISSEEEDEDELDNDIEDSSHDEDANCDGDADSDDDEVGDDDDEGSGHDEDSDCDTEDAEADDSKRRKKVTWASLKRAYERFRQWSSLENMRRVEDWVGESDASVVETVDEPLP